MSSSGVPNGKNIRDDSYGRVRLSRHYSSAFARSDHESIHRRYGPLPRMGQISDRGDRDHSVLMQPGSMGRKVGSA